MKTIDRLIQDLDQQLHHRTQPNLTYLAERLNDIYRIDNGVFFAKILSIPQALIPEIMLELPDELFVEMVEHLPQKFLYNALKQIVSDDVTDFMQRLQILSPDSVDKILPNLDKHQQATINTLSQYNSEQVGAFMQTELISATLHETKADIVEKVRTFRSKHPRSPIIKTFITDQDGRLIAFLHFTDLILFNDTDTIQTIINQINPKHPLSIKPDAALEDMIDLFEDYDLSTLAVVDKDNHLIGRVLFDDIFDVIRQHETRQIYQNAGTDLQAETESASTARNARLNWIFINLFAILLAALVVHLFSDTIHQVVALAVLMPIVAALGGNAGNQAVTVTVRRMALEDIEMKEGWQILKKEFWIGSINGLLVGIAVALITWLWFQNVGLGIVIAAATAINLTLAGFLGAFIPLSIKHFGGDPAIASPLLLTTATDAIGFFVFLGLASLFLL